MELEPIVSQQEEIGAEPTPRSQELPSREAAKAANPWVKRVFILPAVVLVAFLAVFPLAFSIVVAFTGLNFVALAQGVLLPFNGLDNWTRLLGDGIFWKAVQNTALYVILGVPLQYVIGLWLAVLLNGVYGRAQRFFRTVFLIPMMLTPAAVGFVIGRTIFAQQNGPLNFLLERVGLAAIPWEQNGWAAWWRILLVDSWQWVPFMTILLFAGLRSLPAEPYEAAMLDGASPRSVFWRLTFPMLWPVTVTALLIRGVELFKIIDVIQIATQGGPGNATNSVTLYAYDTVFRRFDIGYAAAIAITLLVMMIVFATVFLLMARRRLD
jgi:multiple sugar transport system permease protein